MLTGEESRTTVAIPPTRQATTVLSTYRRLQMAGFNPTEAANLTAHLSGLPIEGQKWTIWEIQHLLFVRSLVESGRLSS
ncbi:MAG: hypothetical protein E6H96_06660 [Chloroflexi bacterium]|nr:MAG: hypothetical protein E6H96_06660 [Chloroflexota bacterium]